MVENIALIQEVHQNKSIDESEALALEMLTKISLETIAYKRIPECSIEEIFFVMYIRALMMDIPKIYIKVPYAITENFKDIQSIIDAMELLKNDKSVMILDLLSNEVHYKGCGCNIIK